MAEVPKPPTLAAEIYVALGLTRQRVRFMAIFTVFVCVFTIGSAYTAEREQEATVDVDVSAFAVSGTAAFELQSLTDEFLDAVTSPSTIRVTAEELGMSTDELDDGITTVRVANATRVTVAFTDEDVDRATEIATSVARNALRRIADSRSAAASRDVDAGRSRFEAATAALDAFEVAQGQRGIPDEFDRLTQLADQLTSEAATTTAGNGEAILAARDEAAARRAVLEPAVREAESLEAERNGAQEQLLDANTRLSEAQSQQGAASSEAVVETGFSSTTSRLPDLISGFATGLVLGALGSYAISWVVLRRRSGNAE